MSEVWSGEATVTEVRLEYHRLQLVGADDEIVATGSTVVAEAGSVTFQLSSSGVDFRVGDKIEFQMRKAL